MPSMDKLISDVLNNRKRGRQGFGVYRPSAAVPLPQIMGRPPEETEGPGWGTMIGEAVGGAGASLGMEKLLDKGDDDGILGRIKTFRESQGGGQDGSVGYASGQPGRFAEGESAGIPTNIGQSGGIYEQLKRLFNKDYEGADKDTSRGWLDVLKGAGLSALQAGANADPRSGVKGILGALAGGGISGATASAIDPTTDNRMLDAMQIGKLLPKYQAEYGIERQREQDTLNDLFKQKQMENVDRDNTYQDERIGELRADRERKVGDREARSATSRMNAVASMFKNIPEFIPGDPKYKELEEALGDVKLPVTQKDAKKKIDLKQDQRTGEWTVILTNPLDGKQEVRAVVKDGKPFKSTPTVVMQGEYGMLKQNDQQQYDREKQLIAAELDKALKDHDAAIKAGQAQAAEAAAIRINDAQERLKAALKIVTPN